MMEAMSITKFLRLESRSSHRAEKLITFENSGSIMLAQQNQYAGSFIAESGID
jgi:hypothetical protein